MGRRLASEGKEVRSEVLQKFRSIGIGVFVLCAGGAHN
jgi:hypothetical protein